MNNTDTLLDYIGTRRLPLIIIIGIYVPIGLAGNLFVLYVYGRRINTTANTHRNGTNSRYFIPSLAVFDMTTLILLSVMLIVKGSFFQEFPTQLLCKGLYFVRCCSEITGGLILLLIAVQRFMCIGLQPTRTLSVSQLRRLLTVVFLCVIVFSSPILYFVDIRDKVIEFGNQNITAQMCSILDPENPVATKMYLLLMQICIVLNIVIVSVLYFKIHRIIHTKLNIAKTDTVRIQTRESKYSPSADEVSSSALNDKPSQDSSTVTKGNTIDEASKGQTPSDDRKNDTNGVKTYTHGVRGATLNKDMTMRSNGTSNDRTQGIHGRATLTKNNTIKSNGTIRRLQRAQKSKSRFTTMFVVILLFYIASYIPVSVIWVTTDDTLVNMLNMSSAKLNVVLFFEANRMLNNIVNPFVYGYYDNVFRRECKKIFCR